MAFYRKTYKKSVSWKVSDWRTAKKCVSFVSIYKKRYKKYAF